MAFQYLEPSVFVILNIVKWMDGEGFAAKPPIFSSLKL